MGNNYQGMNRPVLHRIERTPVPQYPAPRPMVMRGGKPVAGEGNDPRGMERPSALYDQGTDPMSPLNSEHWNRWCDCQGPECTCG